jgi:hypothetical protein
LLVVCFCNCLSSNLLQSAAEVKTHPFTFFIRCLRWRWAFQIYFQYPGCVPIRRIRFNCLGFVWNRRELKLKVSSAC